MKKLMTALLTLAMFFGLASTTQAAGAINADEQRILDDLAIGVNAGGTQLHVSASDMAQAEGVLKRRDTTAAEADTVINNIRAARALVEAQGVSASSLADLMKKLPADVVDQLKGHINAAAAALGLKVQFGPNGITLVGEDAKTGKDKVVAVATGSGKGGATGKANPIVKQTGADYTASLITAVALAVASLGATVLGKKYANA